jgi:hypothetical protein
MALSKARHPMFARILGKQRDSVGKGMTFFAILAITWLCQLPIAARLVQLI